MVAGALGAAIIALIGLGELENLPRHHKVDDVGDEHETDEDRATTRALAIVASSGSGIDALFRYGVRGLGHGSPLEKSVAKEPIQIIVEH